MLDKRLHSKRQEPANVLVGVPIKGLRPLKFGALEQIPVLVLVMVGIGTIGSVNADHKPPASEAGFPILVPAGLPRQIGEQVHKGGKQDTPLPVKAIEGVEPIRKFTHILHTRHFSSGLHNFLHLLVRDSSHLTFLLHFYYLNMPRFPHSNPYRGCIPIRHASSEPRRVLQPASLSYAL